MGFVLVAPGSSLFGAGCLLIGTDGLTGGYSGDGAAVDTGRAGDERSAPEGAATPDVDPPTPDTGAGNDTGGGALVDGPGDDGGGVGGDVGVPEAPSVDAGSQDGTQDAVPLVVTLALTPTRDAYVEDGTSAGTNFGTTTQLVVKSSSTAGVNRNSWLSFDTSGFSGISSATLRLFVTSTQTTATNTIPVLLYYPPASSHSWSETTITWNNAPPAGSDMLSTVNVNDPQVGTWVEFDVTAAVAGETDSTPTFMLTSTAATNRDVMFSSREGAQPPVLQITGTQP
jgi:hypothetical protein